MWHEMSTIKYYHQRAHQDIFTKNRQMQHVTQDWWAGNLSNSTNHAYYRVTFCTVDGVWKPWSDWSSCSVTCGNGTHYRNRTCDGPFYGGRGCGPDDSEMEWCKDRECPIDGVWNPWGEWGVCSHTCGGGTRGRSRTCDGPFYDGAECPGSANDTGSCNTFSCPIDGVWMSWQEWQPCNVTCGGGMQIRQRICDEPKHGGASCVGSATDAQECNTNECPIDGVWKPWGSWGECTLTCGNGTQVRERTCDGPYYGGKDCDPPADETQSCNTHPCPVDGIEGDWSNWGQCSVSCGEGIAYRQRSCIGPFHGGADCQKPLNESGICNDGPCPVDGEWWPWAEWQSCDVTCGGGVQVRKRLCNNPRHGGEKCIGKSNQLQSCNMDPCPINGIWSEWGDWSECSVTCDFGTQRRYRNCTGPFYGGKDCVGFDSDTQSCSLPTCPVDGQYEPWSAWGECTVSCGGGTQMRNRACNSPKHGGADCQGAQNETQDCNTHNCPIDGYWLEWTEWSDCTTTCGGGISQRTRECQEPKYGGQNCQGNSTENVECSENPCPIPGDWMEWTVWSPCSVTCGGGTRTRSRECDMTSYGNLTAPCDGDANEVGDCHTFSCTPHARTCSGWKDRGLEASTMADVDPDGGDGELTSVRVYCDLTAEGGVGVTILGHDNEERTQVVGYEGAGEYKMAITYNVSLDHAIAIIEASAKCKQFLKWECKAALIHNPNGNGVITTGWKNRTGGIADYFSGAMPGTESCACGMNDTCADPGLYCNCDMNDATWREDSGYLTYKPDLPVTEFIAGDTGNVDVEMGYVTVGTLRCFDEAVGK